MSRSSPHARTISEVMTVFSTMSSAMFVFSVASGISSSKILVSRSSASFVTWSFSAFCRESRTRVYSLFSSLCVFCTWLLSWLKAATVSPTANLWASATFLATSPSETTCGESSFSASAKPSGLSPPPHASLACSITELAPAITLPTSPDRCWSFSSASAFCCTSLFMTTSVWRIGPSQGIFQPAPGGRRVLSLQCDQTWVPPSLFPNHQPSKAAPSRLSQ
mmetsp:Transcript_126194/g.356882  ORF Transcript_126194/g.356882 Transcript_126194/m.356882 type:complete len:221 (-) Transcript_126194:805-1467(-)